MEGTRQSEEEALQGIMTQMSKDQQRDMAEVLTAELRRRAEEKKATYGRSAGLSSQVKGADIGASLSRDQMGELYSDIQGNVQQARVRKLEKQIAEARKQSKKLGKRKKIASGGESISRIRLPRPQFTGDMSSIKKMALMYGIALCAIAKILFSTGVVDASTVGLEAEGDGLQTTVAANQNSAIANSTPGKSSSALAGASDQRVVFGQGSVGWSYAEKQILTALDARRVELEKRSAALERKEEDIAKQSQVLAERLAELRTLANRLGEQRKQKEHQYEARLEQLANVYGSMAPKEAAPLMAKLDEETALGLLQRMPGKRIGQILSAMPPDRAIQITTRLSERQSLE